MTRKRTLSQRSSAAQRQRALRANETATQTQDRLLSQAERQRNVRARETPSQTSDRLENRRIALAASRLSETPDQRSQRLANMTNRRNRRVSNNWTSLTEAAFHYEPAIQYASHDMIKIGGMVHECKFCKALKWQGEAPGLCCSNGKIALPLLEDPPEPMFTLLNGASDESRHFLSNTRRYNACFQMTSFGADREIHHGGFQPTFIVQGQIYHRIGALLPSIGEEPKFLQVYFIGDESVDDIQINQRMRNIPGVQRGIVEGLQKLLFDHNVLLQEFKTAMENLPSDNYKVVIHADRTPHGQHQGRYNAPQTHEVAVIMIGNNFGNRDIVLKKQDGHLMRVSDTHRFYDALQYPLMFWKGQEGYHISIPQINPITNQVIPSKKVSSMHFYAFHLMVRRQNGNILLKFRQLLHQFVVDVYVKVESERLRYISLNQRQLRAESYIHLRDAVAADSNINPNDLGQIVILPSSFVNSPRYLAEYTQDAFCYVRNYGRPDLFVTFTTNPQWPEIVSELFPGQKSTDRHDLTARVFRQKLIKFMAAITKGNLFGETKAFMYSIEWQKRGLPHCHLLVWLKTKVHPAQIDLLVCAELPNPADDPELSAIVIKNMIHGPCGSFNQTSPCMINGKCSKKFPKQFIQQTKTNENGYPLYRRRSPEDGGYTAIIKPRTGPEITVDNRWIVPYSPTLSKMFGAHINLEICSSVQAIKYICKYINKGTDQAVFNLQGDSNRNEVENYQAGRYVSSNEAFWRLFGFPLHERHPAVIHLAVHLENGERIYFNQDNLADRLRNPPKTTLTAFFSLCENDAFAKTLLYHEVPKFYTWNSSRKEWKRRVQGQIVSNWPGVKQSDAIGRVYTTDITKFECYCVRLLLHNVRGPNSFKALKTVNGTEVPTYREACDMLGLLESDNHWQATLNEAVISKSPRKLRQLFSIMISACGLSNPPEMWNQFKSHMAEDILHRFQVTNENAVFNDSMFNEALLLIENMVVAMCGKNLEEFGFQRPQRDAVCNIILQRELDYDSAALQEEVDNTMPTLLPEQRAVFNYVLNKITTGQESLIFLDAPGGTGKTYLLNLLLAKVRSQGQIALALASSGIAATLLAGGRTAHSVLKLPLDLAREETPTCNISKHSSRATMLKECKLLVWDEASMSHKKSLEALNVTLKDLRNNNRLMGGLVVLLAGDFRQTLPVISRGTPVDEIDACLKSSTLWAETTTMSLTKNMRVHLHNDQDAAYFSSEILKIGEGNLAMDDAGEVELAIGHIMSSVEELIQKVFENIEHMHTNETWLCERAILAPKNDVVNDINTKVMHHIPGEEKEYLSFDSMVNQDEAASYPIEFLNSINLSGSPSHKITLKIGVPIILMRNLDAPRLCNGTRLRVVDLGTNIIKAKIMTGAYAGEEALLPRIPIIPNNLPFQFRRLQFPIKLAFGMTINKAQGQTLTVAGINLEASCFSHGQLYVAVSRVSSKENLYIYCKNRKTKNIVYKQALK